MRQCKMKAHFFSPSACLRKESWSLHSNIFLYYMAQIFMFCFGRHLSSFICFACFHSAFSGFFARLETIIHPTVQSFYLFHSCFVLFFSIAFPFQWNTYQVSCFLPNATWGKYLFSLLFLFPNVNVKWYAVLVCTPYDNKIYYVLQSHPCPCSLILFLLLLDIM